MSKEYITTLSKKTFLEHKEQLDGFVFHREVENGVQVKTTNKFAIDYLKQIQ